MNHIIKGSCFTNLDDYTTPVRMFSRVPSIGERVICSRQGVRTSLKVVQITHDVVNDEPFIIVELHN